MEKNKNSFTLIELLVVIAIVGILAGIIIVSMSGATDSAITAKAKVFATSMRDSMGNNIISEWNFDGGTAIGSTATNDDVKDSWGTNNGAINGNPIVRGGTDCLSGKCIEFDGVDDYIRVTNSSSLQDINETTISLWFKNTSTGGSQGLISKLYTTKPYWSLWETSLQKIIWEISDSTTSYVKSSTKVNDYGKWIHVAITQKGLNYKLYINGDLAMQGSDVSDFANTKSSNDLLIGILKTTGSTYPFKGLIDEVRIYNSALSLSQIQNIYAVNKNISQSNN